MRKIIVLFALLIIVSILPPKDIFSQGPDQKEEKMRNNKVDAEMSLQESSFAFKDNDVPRAISLIEQSIALSPGYAEAYYRLGVIYLYQKDADKAVECFKKTIYLDPSFVKAYTNLGGILGQLKQYPEAFALYGKALSLENDNPKIYYNIGLIYAATGKKDSANQYFSKAKELCLAVNDTRLLEEIEKVYRD
jgi:tetratricopeptide (TPR) repeat protein